MGNTLLRSGDIKDFKPLGQDGKAVYLVATQIRETFRVKLGKQFANHLAIPQRNDQGNIIDWYIPFDSQQTDGGYDIVPWTSATEEEKQSALAQLGLFEDKVVELGKRLSANNELTGDQLLFSRLIYNPQNSQTNETENIVAIRFPAAEFVYIVNGIPVITFWGFVTADTNINHSPFYCLRPIVPVNEPIKQMVSPFENTIIKQKSWWRFWPWLLALLLLLLLLFLLRGCFYSSAPNIVNTVGDDHDKSITHDPITNPLDNSKPNIHLNNGAGVIVNGNGVDIVDSSAGTGTLHDDTNVVPELDENDQDASSFADDVAQNIDDANNNNELADGDVDTANSVNNDNKLVLSPQALQQGSTEFLNGSWTVRGGIQDKTTGKPLQLKYDFSKGDGSVTVTRSDGVKCVGNIGSNIANSSLNISNNTQATCSDNSQYQMPKIQCQPGSNGVAECYGYYDNGTKFPLTIKKD